MTNSSTLLSLIVALRPKFRSRTDRVAFAAHAYVIAKGYKLEAVGDDAEKASCADTLQSNDDAGDVKGWNASSDTFTFLYNPDLTTQGAIQQPMLLKGVVVGDKLVLNWLSLKSSEAEPEQIDLDVNKFTTASEGIPACYQNIDGLIDALRSKIRPAAECASKHQRTQADRKQPDANATRSAHPQPSNTRQDDFPQAPKRLAQSPGNMIGSNDAVPPGFRPPGYGSLQEPFPGGIGGTGGMHMGPDDPLFAGRAGRGRAGRSGVLPRGAIYDPIGPPGMPGFEPDDFVTGQRRIHPDMAQPGPGRGTDWDSMFG